MEKKTKKRIPRKQEKENAYNNDGQELPGYPHYPAEEDITRAKNNTGKESLDENNISIPNSFDIPGQEHIVPPPLGELADVTASSADEEDIVNGDSLDDRDDVNIIMGTEADVTAEDLKLLEQTEQNYNIQDAVNLQNAGLDDEDEDGAPLNEKDITDDVSGKDLDVPGSDADNANEAIGEEDEENNYYSLGGDNHQAQEEDNGNQ